MCLPPLSFILSTALLATAVHATSFESVWQLGTDDGAVAPFSQENFVPNNAPGSATALDDDYYFAGTYPAPIGSLASNELVTRFERAVTSSDPRNRIHFPLNSAQTSPSSLLRVTVDLIGGGAWINGTIPGYSTHNITIRFNDSRLRRECDHRPQRPSNRTHRRWSRRIHQHRLRATGSRHAGPCRWRQRWHETLVRGSLSTR
ncbi:MAG: hypothetical protein MUF13_15180 [Akkermansiaceae bacterium]|nr:hypothetical protein [Akkermansiaceae bacterium]